jgi:hypothetical protein
MIAIARLPWPRLGQGALMDRNQPTLAATPNRNARCLVDPETGQEKDMGDRHFKPTQRMASAARRGLRLREKFGRGGTQVGVDRAHQLADQRELDEADVKSMHSYFARHAVDRKTDSHEWGSDKDPSAGFIAWLLWGGDAGKAWADRKAKMLES